MNISSFRFGDDDTCILSVGDHPFVKHDSFVFYAKAIISPAENILKGCNVGVLVPQPDLSDEVFARVEAGITASDNTPPNVVRYFTRL